MSLPRLSHACTSTTRRIALSRSITSSARSHHTPREASRASLFGLGLGVALGTAGATYPLWRRDDAIFAEAAVPVKTASPSPATVSVEEQPSKPVVVEPVTGRPIPRNIRVATELGSEEFELMGVGAKRVTFLRFTVYAFSLHVAKSSLTTLRRLASRETFLPGYSSSDPKSFTDAHLETLLKSGEESDIEWAARIEPYRATTGPHLRTGFLQALEAKLKDSASTLSAEEKASITADLDTFASIFPRGPVATGQELVIARTQGGVVRVEMDGAKLGSVSSPWIAENLFAYYLQGGGKAGVPEVRRFELVSSVVLANAHV
ncbi:hypothetical protein M427DRAFT_70380 [Gonapodya prolifera JEL478]|uniref:Chalcone isomerase domain-containing protein n=1 Tax=Gonapodya prolifera (strain JEL478) TaxID=1344416 RepID=A0A139ADS6_GONPJ|nr:hypothetical protein M427DRAFT_70380 [Gonapodya prolifera JEL478]|eukprot:KXS14819.1 hypothetical protein M427DRAFT_70380 [Gonapodya prolifera JEL478]